MSNFHEKVQRHQKVLIQKEIRRLTGQLVSLDGPSPGHGRNAKGRLNSFSVATIVSPIITICDHKALADDLRVRVRQCNT